MRKLILSFAIVLFSTSCTHLFYQPSKQSFFDPKKFGYNYEEIKFKSRDDTELSGWFFPAKNAKKAKGTIVQFHGNAENISTHFLSLAWITKHGYNLFTFDYRGYRKSHGSPSQSGLNDDAVAAIRHATYEFDNGDDDHRVILWGQSLGGAVMLNAIHEIKNEVEISGVVVESSFSSYQNIASEKLSLSAITWLFQPLAYLLVSDSYAPEGKIAELSPLPILVIHGRLDQVVPYHHGLKIYEEAKMPKDILSIPEGRHINSTSVSDAMYRPKILEILETFK